MSQELLQEIFKKYPEMRIRTESKLLEDETGKLYIKTTNGLLEVIANKGELKVQETENKTGLREVSNSAQRMGD